MAQTNHDELLETAAGFAGGYLSKHAAEWERSRGAPRSLFERAAEAGLTGLLIPETLGGRALPYETLIELVETLAYADFSATFALIVHNNHVRAIASAGSDTAL